MSTRTWRGDAQAVAQVGTFTVTAYDAATTYTITINGKTVSVAGVTGTTQTATALYTALAASTIPEFLEVTWTNPSNGVVQGEATSPGKPFTATSSVSGGTGTIGTYSAVTANSGPADWSTAANWTGAAVPTNADDVVFENTSNSCLYGLAQSTVTLTSLTIRQNFTGTIGLPRTAGSGNTAYTEYRQRYLAIGVTTITIGQSDGGGSGRILIDTGSVQTTINIYNTGQAAEAGLKAVQWKGTHASNVVNVVKGSLDVARFSSEVATIATLSMGYLSDVLGDANVRCSVGVTLTTVNKGGGHFEYASNVTTLIQSGGDATALSGTVTTATIEGGTYYYESSGTITNLNVASGAVADFSRSLSARTVTHANLYKGAKVTDPMGTVTATNGWNLNYCTLADVALVLPANLKISTAAVS